MLILGDFNIEPDDLGYHLIVKNANLKDAWIQKPVNLNEVIGKALWLFWIQSQKNC